jgi:hypothetical protein
LEKEYSSKIEHLAKKFLKQKLKLGATLNLSSSNSGLAQMVAESGNDQIQQVDASFGFVC